MTPPARCIHSPQRYTSSAEYHLLVSRASCGASRELSSRRSPALIPHTCAVSPTFRYGAFFFVVFALAAFLSARLTAYGNNAQICILQRFRGVCPRRLYNHMPFSAICLMPNLPLHSPDPVNSETKWINGYNAIVPDCDKPLIRRQDNIDVTCTDSASPQ